MPVPETATALKMTCNAKKFRASLERAFKVIPKQTPKPILFSVRVEADENGVSVSATNLEWSVSVMADGVESLDSHGIVLLPAERTIGILRELGDEVLSIEAGEDTVRLSSGPDEWVLATFPPEDFPAIPPFPADEESLQVSGKDLAAAIDRTVPATDPESTRYALGGCLFEQEADGESLRIIGTDGRCMAIQDIPATGNLGAESRSGVVPAKPLVWATSAMKDAPEVEIWIADGRMAFFHAPGLVLAARLTEGRFPRYKDIIPKVTAVSGTAPCGRLQGAFAKSKFCRNSSTLSVDFTLGDGRFLLRSLSADCGSSNVHLDLPTEGEARSSGINPDYFSILKELPAESEVRLAFDGKLMLSAVCDQFQYHVATCTQE